MPPSIVVVVVVVVVVVKIEVARKKLVDQRAGNPKLLPLAHTPLPWVAASPVSYALHLCKAIHRTTRVRISCPRCLGNRHADRRPSARAMFLHAPPHAGQLHYPLLRTTQSLCIARDWTEIIRYADLV